MIELNLQGNRENHTNTQSILAPLHKKIIHNDIHRNPTSNIRILTVISNLTITFTKSETTNSTFKQQPCKRKFVGRFSFLFLSQSDLNDFNARVYFSIWITIQKKERVRASRFANFPTSPTESQDLRKQYRDIYGGVCIYIEGEKEKERFRG